MVTAVKPRKSKPLPLVDLFRKPKHDKLGQIPSLGSGVQNLPQSSLDMAYEPYTPNTATLLNSLLLERSKSKPRKGYQQNADGMISPTKEMHETSTAAYTTASPSSRSRSLSRDTGVDRTRSSSRSRSYSVGEQSVSVANNLPPVPSIPLEHQLAHKLSKASLNSSNPSSPRSPNHASSSDRRTKDSNEQDRNEIWRNQTYEQQQGKNDHHCPGVENSESPLGRSKSLITSSRGGGYHGPKDTVTTLGSKSNPTTPVTATAAMIPSPRRSRARRATISSSSDEDDNIPLAATNMAPAWLQNKPLIKGIKLKVNLDRSITHSSLLDDDDDDDDEDHIPIAALNPMSPVRGEFMTAADKYKERVRDRIFRDKVTSSSSSEEEEEDNIPIQQTLFMRQKQDRRLSDDLQRRRLSSDQCADDELRGRPRSRTRITASEKQGRGRANNIPPVPRLPSIYS
jgi:hypothetical protein